MPGQPLDKHPLLSAYADPSLEAHWTSDTADQATTSFFNFWQIPHDDTRSLLDDNILNICNRIIPCNRLHILKISKQGKNNSVPLHHYKNNQWFPGWILYPSPV